MNSQKLPEKNWWFKYMMSLSCVQMFNIMSGPVEVIFFLQYQIVETLLWFWGWISAIETGVYHLLSWLVSFLHFKMWSQQHCKCKCNKNIKYLKNNRYRELLFGLSRKPTSTHLSVGQLGWQLVTELVQKIFNRTVPEDDMKTQSYTQVHVGYSKTIIFLFIDRKVKILVSRVSVKWTWD